jgi:hypothetical protein
MGFSVALKSLVKANLLSSFNAIELRLAHAKFQGSSFLKS